MGHPRQKSVKKDQLIQLPDGILSTILSFLTLKEALRTSIFSKSWRFIWTCHSDLSFNAHHLLGSNHLCCSHHQPPANSHITQTTSSSVFVQRVNHFMLRRLEGTKIDSLAIRFHLASDSAPHIDHWIHCAVTKGVEKIDLDFSSWSCFHHEELNQTSSSSSSTTSSQQYYEFPCSFLAPQGRKCTVKHLRLAACSVNNAPPNLITLTSLTTIELQQVNISDQHLKNLLSHCSLLQSLTLHLCKDLVDLNFSGLVLHLNFLNISCCSRLQMIHLYAENLVTFEYTGHLVSFSFNNVPKLAAAFLSFTGHSRLDGVTYALTRFPSDLPQLETLHLLSVLAMKTLNLEENGRIFTNIKQLALTIFPFDDEDKLCWISYILKAFPLLQKLQLNLFAPSYIKQPKEIERLLPECPHKHLTEVEINGFHGNQHEVDLLKYLLDNLKALEELVVSSCQKVYKGHKNWTYEEASLRYKPQLKSVFEWLHALVPPTVHLEIR